MFSISVYQSLVFFLILGGGLTRSMRVVDWGASGGHGILLSLKGGTCKGKRRKGKGGGRGEREERERGEG